jgi:CRP-like cAMP-binding protein
MPEDAQVIALMNNIRLFDGLDNDQLNRVAAVAQLIQLSEADSLRQEGADNSLYIVASGKVRFIYLNKGSEDIAYVLKQGDFFGGDVIFRGKTKPYILEALQPTLLLCFQVGQLRSLLNTNPVFTKNIKKQLAWYNLIH